MSKLPTALLASLDLWHRRLGHVDPNTVKAMVNNKVVEGIEFQSSGVNQCEGCILGKGRRAPFPKFSTTRSTSLLEIVNSDVMSPFEVSSLGGSRYVVTFIDDFSRWTVTYAMKSKAEV